MTRIEPAAQSRCTALAPDLRALSDRAARAWAERMAVSRREDGAYVVTTESDHAYVVDLEAHSCTCPDHQIRGERCKHLRRVAIEITARRIAPPGKDLARCDACDAVTFVPSDAAPPDLCADCRLLPGDVVVDQETGDRLVVLAVTPDRADEWVVAQTGSTVAEYETNDGYPADDLVVEAAYLPAFYRSDEPRRYAFPLSRLSPTGTQFLGGDTTTQQTLPI